MKLALRSYGGFTGKAGAVTRSVDLGALSAAQRLEVQDLVEHAHVFDRPAKMKLAAPRPWDFNYILEVQDGTRKQHIELHLDAVDDSLRALIAWLEELEVSENV